MYYYSAYGLIIQSEIFQPEFIPSPPPPTKPDVIVRIRDRRKRSFPYVNGLLKERCNGGVIIHWQDVASYKVVNGNIVTIYPHDNATELMVRQPLYGIVIATLLMQQDNLLVLHGSVIELHGRALIIVGQQGAGKSTLAAFFMSKGSRLIADDVAALQFDYSAGNTKVLTGLPHIRLWPDTAHFLGFDLQTLPCVNHMTQKRVYSAREYFTRGSFSLGGVITFGSSDGVVISELTSAEKMKCLISSHYFAKSPALLSFEEQKRTFLHTAYLSKNSRIVRLCRPGSLEYLAETTEKIEQYFRDQLAAADVQSEVCND